MPFEYVAKTFISVPVTLNGSITKRFIVDTGAGISVVSKSLCAELGCKLDGDFTGKRMSGQSVKIPLAKIQSLAVGDINHSDMTVGLFDMDVLMPGAGIDGIVALDFFRNLSVSFNYKNNTLTFETASSVDEIVGKGASVPVKFEIEGPSVGILMQQHSSSNCSLF